MLAIEHIYYSPKIGFPLGVESPPNVITLLWSDVTTINVSDKLTSDRITNKADSKTSVSSKALYGLL